MNSQTRLQECGYLHCRGKFLVAVDSDKEYCSKGCREAEKQRKEETEQLIAE